MSEELTTAEMTMLWATPTGVSVLYHPLPFLSEIEDMADIVGRGQVRILLPYVRGTGGPPILVISHPTRTLSYATAYPP